MMELAGVRRRGIHIRTPWGATAPGRIAAIPLLALLLPVLAAPAGCDSSGAPQVVSAEILDDGASDGSTGAGQTIRITLDRPLAQGFRGDGVKAWCGPPRSPLLVRAEVRRNPEILDLEILSTPPAFTLDGIFTGDPQASRGPTGIGIDLGPASPREQWVDLQERRPSPVLVRAIWEDRGPAGSNAGNLAVDQGDWIRLVFDRPIRVRGAEGKEPIPLRVPGDLLLASPEDRLDDGTAPSILREGPVPREAVVVLGSNPRLTIAGRLALPGAEGRWRPGPFRPSGIALDGTSVAPSARILDRRGWPGAVSHGPVDIEFAPGYFFFEKRAGRADEAFPPPGHRSHHTLTSIAGGRAVIAGGRTWDGKAIGKVLLFNPEADRPLSAIGDLAEPRYLHTAALMAGEDGITGTLDDFILIAGGTNGSHSLSSLAAVRLDPLSPDRLSVEPLEAKLQRPRMYHTAVFIPPAFLLIDGGRSAAPSGGGGILPVAELLELDSRGERISVGRRWEFRTLARMRHSTTFLGTGPDGAAWVLGYGGFGTWPEGQILRDRQSQADPRRGLEDRFNPDEGVVLAAPELLRIEAGPGSTAEAKLDVMPLDFEFRHEMLRYDHRAAPVLFDALTARGGEARQVLIAGGSLQPLNYDPDRPGRTLFEPPRRPEDALLLARKPPVEACAAAILFEFHPEEPAKSSFQVISSPTGDRRSHCVLVPLTAPGVLILGGEIPDQPEEPYATGEIYLPRERRLAPLAIPLTTPRTRFGAFSIEGPGGPTVHILGGATSADETAGFADVERLRMEKR